MLNPSALGTEGLVSGTVYDKRGLVTSDTDANGKTTFYAYNAFGQLIELTDSLGTKSQAAYDARGNLIQITDAKGNVARFEYDRNNRMTREILPLGQATSYQYDAQGNLLQRIDPTGNKGVFEVDVLNRFTTIKRYGPSNGLQSTTTFGWDAENNQIAWSETDHTRGQTTSATLTYDDANRKIGETVTYPLGNTLSYGYSYSAAGKKTRLTWADGSAIDYGYSAHGELETVAIPGEGTISVNQFKWTAPAKVTLPGGTVQERSYDGLLDLQSLKVKNTAQQTVLNLQNTYGKVQELKQSSRTDTFGSLSFTKAGSYAYDAEVRLTQAQVDSGGLIGTATETFTLDAVGNRVAHSQVSGAWSYDSNNRLTQRGTGAYATTYQYDDAGSLIRRTEPSSKVTQYVYDAQLRLIEVKDGAGAPAARYGYDPLGRRSWKEQYRDGSGNTLAPARRTYYLYADEGLIAESTQDIKLNADLTVIATGPLQITTQYGPTPDSVFATNVLFVKTKASDGSDMVAYYHHDQLGAPIQATNKSGAVVWAASYNVFGQGQITTPLASAGSPVIDSNLRLPGQYFDEETGLHYNYFRYYDPTTGRYIQDDPIGLDGDTNRYAYANSNPLTGADPYGLFNIFKPADWPTVPQSWIDDIAGVGDGMLAIVSFGLWNGEAVRERLGIVSVDTCSDAYGRGKIIGELAATLILLRARPRSPCNSFPENTLVHVRPADASEEDALTGMTAVKAISQLRVGDEVLALSEWKDKGNAPIFDRRLSYEKILDVLTSFKEQTLVHLTLDNGQSLTVTDGHPLRTSEGWRDAILMKRGEKLFLKDNDGVSSDVSAATINEVRIEITVVPVINLEVANAHTYFVGELAALVHNAPCPRVAALRKDFENKVRPNYWKDKARTNPIGYSSSDLARMRVGRPPIGADGRSMELHHIQSLENGGTNARANLREMTFTDHRKGPNFRMNHP